MDLSIEDRSKGLAIETVGKQKKGPAFLASPLKGASTTMPEGRSAASQFVRKDYLISV
ncbi:hypothetical protein LP7551_01321 [Roseibium album]|nr:hypothetical protein LP7551_01321 [Roseibium album]